MKYFFIALMMAYLLTGCSMQKNTWSTRALQSLNTRYNVYFNGYQSYQDGMKAISTASKDDYTRIIPMYPISNHENAKAATSQMDRTIEKARKAIKTRSMKMKPEAKRGSRTSSKSRQQPKQEEFNPFMPQVWLLLAKAEFHKADFLGAVGTLNYTMRHFPNDPDLAQTCQLWVIRSYGEMGWQYEAEEMLSKITQSQLSPDNAALYAAVAADLKLKRGLYREAIPFLELALSKERETDMKLRFTFLMAQLYQFSGDKKQADEAYSRLIKMSPPYEMAFNAKISRAGLFLGNMNDNRRELLKMAKNDNNSDYLDQLYFVIGNTYLHQKDTLMALKYYDDAVEFSTRNGIDKASALIKSGDLYYQRKNYVKAQPCYDDARKIIPLEHPDYTRISLRAEMLAELVVEYETVQLQDSLQRLSAMPEAERLKNILAYIENLKKEEALAAEKEAQRKEREQTAGEVPDNNNFNPESFDMIGAPPSGNRAAWYFYNTALIRSGELEFQKKWGKRKLEDNWRRSRKNAALFSEDQSVQPGQTDSLEIQGADSVALIQNDSVLSDDKNPEFYLRQIPETPEQIARSNDLWAKALFNMGVIYKDKLEDIPLAIQSFEDYLQRFKSYESAVDAIYHAYMLKLKLGENDDAERLRLQLVEEFPESKYAQMLTNKDFLNTKQQMFAEQDSLYQLTYEAFNKSDYPAVFMQVEDVQKRYPMNSLMPKFLFLKALSVGKSKTKDEFETALTELVETYPESDVSSISKDMLALIRQGREAQQGSSHGTILARRELSIIGENGEELEKLMFKFERNAEQRLLLISPEADEKLYPLQFQLAVFNFSRFILKDFELNISRIDSTRNSLSVISFDNATDADWYLNAIHEDEKLVPLLKQLNVTPLVISEYDFGLTKSGFTFDEYLTNRAAFQKEQQEKESLKAEEKLPEETPKKPAKVKRPVKNTKKTTR